MSSVTFLGEFIFQLYRMCICTTKNKGMIENKSIKKNQIMEKLLIPLQAIREDSQYKDRKKARAHKVAGLGGPVPSVDTARPACARADTRATGSKIA